MTNSKNPVLRNKISGDLFMFGENSVFNWVILNFRFCKLYFQSRHSFIDLTHGQLFFIFLSLDLNVNNDKRTN